MSGASLAGQGQRSRMGSQSDTSNCMGTSYSSVVWPDAGQVSRVLLRRQYHRLLNSRCRQLLVWHCRQFRETIFPAENRASGHWLLLQCFEQAEPLSWCSYIDPCSGTDQVVYWQTRQKHCYHVSASFRLRSFPSHGLTMTTWAYRETSAQGRIPLRLWPSWRGHRTWRRAVPCMVMTVVLSCCCLPQHCKHIQCNSICLGKAKALVGSQWQRVIL